MKLTKLNEIYDNWLSGDGVFTDLNALDVPWKDENNTNSLNMAYHGNHSGDKNISPIVYKFLKGEVENPRGKLANVIFTMFNDKWSKLWNALEIEYNPLNNYDMIETETTSETVDNTETHNGTDTLTMTGTNTNALSGKDTEKHTGTDTINHTGTDANASSGSDSTTHTGTDTNALSGKDTEKHTGTDTNALSGVDSTTHTGTDNINHTGNTTNEVSAFNSSSYEDNTKDTQNTTDAETKNLTDATTFGKTETRTLNTSDAESLNLTDETTFGKTSTETRNMTDTTTHNTTRDVDESRDIERELTRSGNIGVMSSQALLQSEIDLRKWLYYESVFNDIDTILTLSIY